jgi:hypothetical protein
MTTQYFRFCLCSALSGFHVKIEAEDASHCSEEMTKLFGNSWAFQYTQKPENTIELPLTRDKHGLLKLSPRTLKLRAAQLQYPS